MTDRPAELRSLRREDMRHGLQLVAADGIAYLLAAALALPESFWAVMSALIVVRSTAGSSFGVGWNRVRGTVAGTLLGLGGVWLRHHGVDAAMGTLAIVAVLAYFSALTPALRSAPIGALIVLTSADAVGHSALGVALLRVAEIAIGVGAGIVVSLVGLGARAHARFDAACAAVLRRTAAQVRRDLGVVASGTDEREAAVAELRLALRELAILGMSADREARLFAFGASGRPAGTEERSRKARLVARIAHDAGSFGRLAEFTDAEGSAPAWAAFGSSVGEALEIAARRLEDRADGESAGLRVFLKGEAPGGADASVRRWAVPAARLLARDLARLTARAEPVRAA
ncbi:MAG TPA: FUSC family protein [Caldimonas sp.]